MADPFEVRVRFSAQLQNLSASVASSQRAATTALRHKDMDEDLHSCIIEQLEKPQTALNKRANIMYFIEHLLELAQREGNNDYVAMLQRDIIRVVDAVAPESGQGAANVKVVRRVLNNLQQKGFLEAQAVTEIEEVLKERETDLMSSPAMGRHGGEAGASGGRGAGGQDGGSGADGATDDAANTNNQARSQSNSSRRQNGRGGADAGAGRNSAGGLDKKQIEERIEEDRERHKRLREGIWAIPKGPDAEMWKLWDETSDLGEDDHLMGEEELAEREKTVHTSCVHRAERLAAGAPSLVEPNGR
ncbi:ctd kinase subunit gamma [Ophiostoma piceae UAMH 11346]|uniref:Ctd kinase subunit gamma n=1 Tax=Ophiostoma piceae (strain UAMH 11346) TaxID=1262450 RepID=S3C5P3_OPHP1|nr:ctd kinase subunit gamma [Ophiostoma piceae UAMH 11346]